ncbi:hypothetical protein ACVWZR_008988 [Bradyrhizobium sp. i1.3.1]
MSRGMPSMTALLGMLAIAGYQNRDSPTCFATLPPVSQAGAKDSLSGMLAILAALWEAAA